MEHKLHSISGIVLAVVVLASIALAAHPATVSAGTLTPTNEFDPPTCAGADIVDIAVAGDGKTVYAAGGTTDLHRSTPSDGSQLLVKSFDGGSKWSSAATPGDASGAGAWTGNIPSSTVSVSRVAIAPDTADGSWLAIIVSDNASGTPLPAVYVSADGGAVWNTLGTPPGAVRLRDIAVAGPAGAGNRTVAAAGDNGTSAKVWILQSGATAGWIDTSAGPWNSADYDATATSAWTVRFSPGYSGDRTIAAVTSGGSGTRLQLADANLRVWNGVRFFSSGGQGIQIVADNVGSPGSVSLALAPGFSGNAPSSRVAYVGLTAAGAANHGLFRIADTFVTRLSGRKIGGLAINGAGDRLVAGSFDTSDVFRVASPSSAASSDVSSATPSKRPAPDSGVRGAFDGNERVVVAFAGAIVVAGNTGPQSAFSRSSDEGKTFNGISLVDTPDGALPKDFAVSPDGGRIYVATYDDTDGINCLSLWRKLTVWERVLTTLTPATSILVRSAPENAEVVHVAVTNGTAASQIHSSTDGGQTDWRQSFAFGPLTDMVTDGGAAIYGLSGARVARSATSDGFLDPGETLSFEGATITSLGTGSLIVGGTRGEVAYLMGGTWTTIDAPIPGGGRTQATANIMANGQDIFASADTGISGESANVYRWKIGASSSWTAMRTTDTPNVFGMVFRGDALYVIADNGTNTSLYRTTTPGTADSDVSWSAVSPLLDTTSEGASEASPFLVRCTDMPQALFTTVGADKFPKLWALDTGSGRLESFTDILVKASPGLAQPADKFEVPINVATGQANQVVFRWAAIANTPPNTTYRLQIALDTAFTQMFADLSPIDTTMAIVGPDAGPIGAAPGAPAGDCAFQSGTNYYWRVRVESPMPSEYSAVPMNFRIASLSPLTISSPPVGATNVEVKPLFAWSTVTGATSYEITVSDNKEFTTTVFSRIVDRPSFAADQQLAYGTVYYWRVRAIAPATTVTPFVYGVFTTESRSPVVASAPPLTITQAVPDTSVRVVQSLPSPIVPRLLLFAGIIIGAILVIVVVIAIARNSRSPIRR